MIESFFAKNFRSNLISGVLITWTMNALAAAPLVWFAESAAAKGRNDQEREDSSAGERAGMSNVLFNDLEVGVGAFGGSGQYHGSAVRDSIVQRQFYTSGVVLETVGKRFGFMFSSTTQISNQRESLKYPFRISLESDIVTAAAVSRFVLRPEKSAILFRLGASHAQRDLHLSDEYLEKHEESATAGPFAGLTLVATLGDHLSGDISGAARVLPLKIDVLGVNDKGLQSEWTAGLTLRF